jgi:hypothetical protein
LNHRDHRGHGGKIGKLCVLRALCGEFLSGAIKSAKVVKEIGDWRLEINQFLISKKILLYTRAAYMSPSPRPYFMGA